MRYFYFRPSSTSQTNKENSEFFGAEQEGSFFKSGEYSGDKGHFFNAQSSTLQTKPAFGSSGDAEEQEAEYMADVVVGSGSVQRKPVFESEEEPAVQRKCAACEEEEKLQTKEEPLAQEITNIQRKPIFESHEDSLKDPVQRKCAACEQEEKLQMVKGEEQEEEPDVMTKAAASAPADTHDLHSQLNTSKGSGAPLSENTKVSMESAFGADFSGVKVHTDRSAVQMNKDLNAQAFTHGSDIYFNEGNYNDKSNSGQHLLAHELTHVVQQGSVFKKDIIQKDEKKPAKPKKGSAASANKLSFIPSKNGEPCACIIVIHNDEENARKTAQLMHDHCSYNLILLEPNHGGRDINIPKNGTKDPNELFPKEVAGLCMKDEQQCKDFISKKGDSTDKDDVLKFVQIQFFLTIKKGSKNFSIPVISLHNNDLEDTDPAADGSDTYMKKKSADTSKKLKEFGGIDKTDEAKGKEETQKLKDVLKEQFNEKIKNRVTTKGKTNIFRWCLSEDLTKCHIGDPDHPDQVVWVTDDNDFKKLKQKDINVVLQTNDLSKGGGAGESDTDLSTLFITLKDIIVQLKQDETGKVILEIMNGLEDIKEIIQEVENLTKHNDLTMGEGFNSLKKIIFELIGILFKIARLLGINLIRFVQANNIRFINIETPIDKIKDQTDTGRKENYMFIANALDAAGLHCCGEDPKKAEESIKSGLELEKK